MIRTATFCVLIALIGASPAFGQPTQPAEQFDSAAFYKETMALIRQTAQMQTRLEANYREQANDYNRRVDAQEQEQRRQYEDAQTRAQYVYVLAFAFLILLIVWGVLATRKSHRKQEAAVVAIEKGRLQNDQMIQALHAIAVKLDEVKLLLSSGNRG